MVGRSGPWLACCRDVDNAYRAGQWTVLSGEAGSGKVALARAAHQQNNPAGALRLLDAASSPDLASDVEAELLRRHRPGLVIRHAERLAHPSSTNWSAPSTAAVEHRRPTRPG